MSAAMTPVAAAALLVGTKYARPSRDSKIDALEAELRKQPEGLRSQFEPEITHHFAPHLYAREMRIRKGAAITSKVHKEAGLSILSKGSMALYMEDGTVQVVTAGFHIVAAPGTRRVAVVLEDAVWTCMHPTDETDVAKIEEIFIAQTPADYLEFINQQEGSMPNIEHSSEVLP